MCGRFAVWELEEINRLYNLKPGSMSDFNPRYNAAPSQNLPIITKPESHIVSPMRWGLIPFWAKDIKIGYKMINTRSETVFEKPAFRNAIKNNRCLVPVNGFYEWKKTPDGKQPFFIGLRDRSTFSFAGIYENWTNKDTGEKIQSFSILTTAPNQAMSDIHDRMPVILSSEQEDEWLDNDEPKFLSEMFKPYDNDQIKMHPVSNEVNTPKVDKPSLIESLA